eukprot:CAMPEP_0202443338 /NCGR_PEP_ID=MMETSP1360-20130828/2645_1 /ASSEMBLY_ACC=CAM_ASM_000848 /TAXON_ID=515479 /ORGANISM="Licmophora paradoxa, Strain CCMP2313" /LENGTH=66 /DNA_ID=CAMNT_0049059011 /DNA_START=160 /DNA_END=360 /DNA_ORIENTATION=+
MSQGLEDMILNTSGGLVAGGILGLVLSRGRSSAARRIFSGLGAGCGLGSSWTKTSMELEDKLKNSD